MEQYLTTRARVKSTKSFNRWIFITLLCLFSFITGWSQADVALTSWSNKLKITNGETFTTRVVVHNQLKSNVTGLQVVVSPTSGISQTSFSAPGGTMFAGGTWNIGNALNASIDSLILIINYTATGEGTHYLNAEVTAMNEVDLDSNPGDGVISQDDYTSSCVTIPFRLCSASGDTITLTAAPGFTNYQWFINQGFGDQPINGATGPIYKAYLPGDYTYVATDPISLCPVNMCCPIVLDQKCFDLALYKKLSTGQAEMVAPGDIVTFTITVVNQGEIPADNIQITDYIPSNMSFVPQAGWSASGSLATRSLTSGMELPIGGLLPNTQVTVDIQLQVNVLTPYNTIIVNWAEISNATDEKGDPVIDIDSWMDQDPTNDIFLVDNLINDNGKELGDEDDHDPAQVVVLPFDLALFKQLANGQPSQVAPGDDVTFTITVVNQGMIAASAIEVTDYIPSGLTFDPGKNHVDWTLSGSTFKRILPGILPPGASVSIDIVLTVDAPMASNTVLTNWAEISSTLDGNGNPVIDIDSTPDDDPNNDLYLVDNEINGDGKNGGDEDDHDPASVVVLPFDLALYKTLANGQASQVAPGDDVTFTITVVNQGMIAASAVEVADYIPSGFSFVAGKNHVDWNLTGNTAKRIIPGILAPGASISIDIVLTVDAPLASNTVLTNWAEISSTLDGNGNPVIDIDSTPDDDPNNDLYLVDNEINGDGKNGGDEDDHDPASVVVLPFDLALIKQLANGQAAMVSPGDKVTFNITVFNQGMITAGNIQLVDYVPAGMTFDLADNPGWSVSGPNFVYNLPGTLAPGASMATNVILTVNNPIPANTKLVNWAEIAAATDGNGNPQTDIDSTPDQINDDTFLVDDYIDGDGKNNGDEDDHDKAEVVVLPFDLALYKQRANGQPYQVAPGEDVTFTITVVNQGLVTATNIEVTDYVPTDMTFIGASNPLWSFAAGKAKRTIAGPLAPGQSTTIDIVLRVNSPLASNTTITNWAEISSARDLNNVVQPDIDSNADDVNNDLFLVDDYIDGDGKNGGDEDDHDKADVVVLPFDLALIKELAVGQSANVQAGADVTFTITVFNQGLITAGNIQIVDYIPTDMTFDPSKNPGWSLSSGNAITTLPGTLAPGTTTTVNIILTLNAPLPSGTKIRNWAEIAAATDGNGNPQVDIDSTPDEVNNDTFLQDNEISGNGKNGEDEDDHDMAEVIVDPFDLALFKQRSPGQPENVKPGDNVSFTITVINQGLVPAANIEVTDYVPAEMTFVAGNNPGWSFAAGKAKLVLPGILAPGAATTTTIILTVNNPLAANTVIYNWAEISSATDQLGNPQVDIDSDPDDSNNDLFLIDDYVDGNGKQGGDEDDHDRAIVVVDPFDLALYKQLAPGQQLLVAPGENVTFRITVVNQGAITATAIEVTDYVSSNMTFEAASNPLWSFSSGKAKRIIAGPLAPGASTSIDIVLRVNAPLASNTEIVNWAEISEARDIHGVVQPDIDSDADDTNNDLFLVDDYIDGDGKNGGDEDDHDRAHVIVLPFDLALDKVLSPGQNATVAPGDKVSFDIRIYNQGLITANNIEITDYIPTGMSFDGADNPGWVLATSKAKTTITTPLNPGTFTTRTIVLTVDNPLPAGTTLQNWAEISSATDGAGNPVIDIDSDMDDSNNDKYVNNNDIYGNGKAGEDEDDHDQETVVVKRFDLALTKTLSPGQPLEIFPGQNVSYRITVYNQGEYNAYNIAVTDYPDAGCHTFDAGINPGWALLSGRPTYIIPGPLAPGASTHVTLILGTVAPKLGQTELWNWAEISDARDVNNVPQIDDDSTPDTNPNNDVYLQDNEISGNGKAGEDEDDHDPALVIMKIFDLALYKQLAPGESISVEPGDVRTFNIFVVNQGGMPADNIEVTDYIPLGMTLLDANWTLTGQLATRTLTAGAELPIGGLLPGQTAMVTIMLQVPNPIPVSTKLVNWAEISNASDIFGTPVVDIDSWMDQDVSNDKFLIDDYIGGDAKNKGDDEDDHDQAYVMYRVYDLALRKTVDNDCPVRPGDTVHYTITVFNQGTETVQDVVLVDSVASGYTFDPGIQLWGWHYDGTPHRVTFRITDIIEPKDSFKVTLHYIIKPGCRYYNDLWNFAEIASFKDINGVRRDDDDIDSKPDKNFWNDLTINDIIDNDGTLDEDDHDIQIPPIFDLAIRMIELVDLPVVIGQDVAYEITVFNQGNITAQNIDLKHWMPKGFILSPNNTNNWDNLGTMATITLAGPLEPADSVKVQILLRVTKDAHEGDLMNYVEIQGAQDMLGKDLSSFDFDSDPDMDPFNDLLTDNIIDKCKEIEEDDNDKATVELFDLALRKSPYHRQRVLWGDDVTFTITVFNQSPILSAQNIGIVDYLPTGFSLSPIDANGWNPGSPGQIINTISGPIAPGDSASINVILRVDIGAPGGDTNNTAEITYAEDTNGRNLTDYDFDSFPDTDPSNDVVVDNEIHGHNHGDEDEDDHDIAPIFVEIFDLALRKTHNEDCPVIYGQDVPFTITVFNQGNVPATDIELRDYMPSGFKMKFANLNGWTQNASNLNYKIAGPLNPGEQTTVNIILTVQEEASPYGLTNIVEIIKAKNELGQDRTGKDIDSDNDSNPFNDTVKDDVIDEQAKLNPGDDEDDHDIATVDMFDLALRKTTPVKKPVTVGDDVLFTIEVFNQGSVAAKNIALIDYIPAGFKLSPLSTGTWIDMANGTATALLPGPIAAGESDTIDIYLTVDIDASAGSFTNFSEITYAERTDGKNMTPFDVDAKYDTDPTNDKYVDDEINDNGKIDEDDHDGATVEVEIIDLALKKIIQYKDMAPVKIGEDVSFAIEIFNQGSVTMYDIGIVDYIPSGFDYSPTDGNLWTVVGNKAYNTIAGPLFPGQKRSIGIVLRVNGNASVENLINGAEIISAKDPNGDERAHDDRDSDPDEDPWNDDFVNDEIKERPPVDEDDHDFEGVPVFDLALRKTPNFSGKVTVGDDIEFTVRVFNQGNIAATNVKLVDYIPSGTSLSPNDANGWTQSGALATTTLAGPIAPNTFQDVLILLRVLPTATAGVKTNATEITAAMDDKGNDMTDRDLDSTPDDIANNDNVKDDVIIENGQGTNDEDDHDIATFEIEIIDLALRKTLHVSNKVNPISVGDDVIFEIEIFNQGSVTMKNIKLIDYYPPGFVLSLNDGNNWLDNGDGTASLTFPYTLPPGQSATVGIVLTLQKKKQLGYLCNAAEITYMEDINGNDRSDKDRDSTPDTDPDNDAVVDDEIFSKPPVDEDDHDIAKVLVDGFDLALIKQVGPAQIYPIVPGDPILFNITVFNQGTYDAYNIKLVDYIPAGLEIIDPNWTVIGTTAVLNTPIPFLAAGDQIVIGLQTKVGNTFQGFSLINKAEIYQADDDDDPTNGFPDDNDSTPDTDPDNDIVGGNDVTDNTNDDEDDHDFEPIEIKQTFDLALVKILANGQKAVVVPGDTVRFTIYAINQGTLDAYDITVKDYVPTGLNYDVNLNTSLNTSNPYHWLPNVTYIVPGPLAPNDSTSIDILLIVDKNTQLDKICNAAEIAHAAISPGGPNAPDEDSTPDDNPNNDIFGGDNITDNTNNDEDDHDESCIHLNQVFDLALIKQTNASNVKPGDHIDFHITIFNQGTQAAYDVDVVDYIPTGFIFHAGDNPDWTFDGVDKAVMRIQGPIEAQTSMVVHIVLQVDPVFSVPSLTNLAEIKRAAKFIGGPDAVDEDSTPDDDPLNDIIGGDDITDNSNNDEDDHDFVFIPLEPCVLSLKDVPGDVTIECDAVGNLPNNVYVKETGGCCLPTTIELETLTIPSAQCPQNYLLVRTWTARDKCGHVVTQSQTVTVKDSKAPVFTKLPLNVTIECDQQPPSSAIGVDITAIDNCDPDPVITFTENVKPGSCKDQYEIIRTWKVTDMCGNTATHNQIIYVLDIQKPVFTTTVNDITVNCGENPPAPPVVDASDKCDLNVTIEFKEFPIGSANCASTPAYRREWTATDNCGNFDVLTQLIYINDNTAPEISGVPGNVTAECDNVPQPATPNVKDACDPKPLLEYAQTIQPGNCPGNYTITRKWTAKDHCGNISTATQVITVQDTQAPVITFTHPDLIGIKVGDTIKIACNSNLPIYGPSNVKVVDNCDSNPTLKFIDELISEDGCKKLIYCEWLATDHCGNTTSKYFYMQIGDFAPPSIVGVPAHITIECDIPVPPAAKLSATDDCDPNPKVSLVETTDPAACPQEKVIKRTWTAEDNCGNKSTATQIITVRDTKAPVFSNVPQNVTISCTDPVPGSTPIANDACDPKPSMTAASSIQQLNCGYIIEKSWTSTDACGNSSTVTQRVTVTDTEAPVLSGVPANITIECDQSIPVAAKPSVIDACDQNPVVTLQESTQQGSCTHSYFVLRIWTATDNCGNKSTASQLITIRDTKAPVLSGIPNDITLSCGDNPPNPPQVTASDNCDNNPAISFKEDVISQGNCTTVIIRTYTATDKCQNSTAKSYKITLVDTDKPVFTSVPPAITISCEQPLPPSNAAQATDKCGTVTVSAADVKQSGTCPDNYTILRTYTATDACGNTTTVTQQITVDDKKAPVITPLHPDIAGASNGATLTFNCDELPVLGTDDVKATDNCDPNPDISFFESVKHGDCQKDGYYLELTCSWKATDRCGNTSTFVLYMRLTDTKAPTFTSVPSHATIECGEPLPGDTAKAEDNCDNDVQISVNVTEDDLPCGKKVIRTFTATDDCGNTKTAQQVITITDKKAPLLTGVPADITVDAKLGQSVPPPANVTASDECSGPATVTLVEVKTDGQCGYILIRTWTATDQCGNTSSASQTIVVDEGCPCSDPVLDELILVQPKCGKKDGSITVLLEGNESDYNFTWLPNKGVPNAIGNSRTGLTPGVYHIIATSKQSGNCFLKLTAELKYATTCVDTVYIQIPMAQPYGYCVTQKVDVPGTITSASVCGYDSHAISSVTLDQTSGCMVIDPEDTFTGQTTICVVHCDDSDPTICDTTYIVVTINAIAPPCDDIIVDAAKEYTIVKCDALAPICLDIPLDEMVQYTIEINGKTYNNGITGCDFDSTFAYTYFGLPGKGASGPYSVTSWSINGQSFSGNFMTIEELVNKLNIWDPTGNWTLNAPVYIISGGNPGSKYGQMIIFHNSSSTQTLLEVNINLVPNGSAILLPEGIHTVLVTNQLTGCDDKVTITVFCDEVTESIVANDDETFVLKNKSTIITVLANDIIPGNDLGDFYVKVWPKHGTLKLTEDNKFIYQPNLNYCGYDDFVYEICNDQSCDEAKVTIDVRCLEIIVNNGISPNSDGINDFFVIEGIQAFPNNELSIFNRWGNLVFFQKGYKNNWNGTWDGGNLPDGTYYYLLDDGEGTTFSGYIQIQR